MGAIFGIVGEGSLDEVRAMREPVIHRGEYQQFWSPAPNVYFGQAEHRPFEIADQSIAVDGHIAADDLTLAGLFGRLGLEALASLRGTFALALCDGPGVVTLAVDQVGYKSLYYTILRGRFAFASEYKSLLTLADLPLEPDRMAIQHYLATKYPLGGRSFLARTRALQGGHMLQWRDGHATVAPYWKPGTHVVPRSREQHVAVVRDALLETVHRQVHAYERVGITIGGGVDAAIVLGAIRRVAPPLAGQFITLIKSSSIVSLISIQELTFTATEIAVTTERVFETWIVVGAMYFVVCYACSLAFARLERRVSG